MPIVLLLFLYCVSNLAFAGQILKRVDDVTLHIITNDIERDRFVEGDSALLANAKLGLIQQISIVKINQEIIIVRCKTICSDQWKLHTPVSFRDIEQKPSKEKSREPTKDKGMSFSIALLGGSPITSPYRGFQHFQEAYEFKKVTGHMLGVRLQGYEKESAGLVWALGYFDEAIKGKIKFAGKGFAFKHSAAGVSLLSGVSFFDSKMFRMVFLLHKKIALYKEVLVTGGEEDIKYRPDIPSLSIDGVMWSVLYKITEKQEIFLELDDEYFARPLIHRVLPFISSDFIGASGLKLGVSFEF